MAKKSDLVNNYLKKRDAEESITDFQTMLDLVTASTKPAPLPPLGLEAMPESLDSYFASVKAVIIPTLEYMAAANRNPKDVLYPFLLCYSKLPKTLRRQGKFSLDELLDLINTQLPPEKQVPIGEVRRRIVYNLDLVNQDAALTKLHAYKPKILETSIQLALDPSHEDSFKERDELLKMTGLRLQNKNQQQQINIVTTNQTNNVANITGLPKFEDTLSITSNTRPSSVTQQQQLEAFAARTMQGDVEEAQIEQSQVEDAIIVNRQLGQDEILSDIDMAQEKQLLNIYQQAKQTMAQKQNDEDVEDEDEDYYNEEEEELIN